MEIETVPFSKEYEAGYNEMIRDVIAEHGLTEAHKNHKPQLPDLFWLVLDSGEVVGSVGLLIKRDYAVLKRMFLLADYRGKEKGVSAKLLSTALDWCKANNISKIYLGTIDVFEAAMAFYEKNGFVKITESDLPDDFPHNPIDKVFYRLDF
ncbi:MAG: GNAT family N-acetyltransferase [Bacteroidia bacterium]